MAESAGEKYRVVSLFSGAMGLDLGLENTGRFELLACVEVEKAFCDTIRANIAAGSLPKRLKVVEADIANLSVESFLHQTGIDPADVDVLVGGPPCQTFSTAGRRKGTQDPRGTLLWDFLRFVDGLSPKFFLMENVRGLLSAALSHRPIAERPQRGGPPLSNDEIAGSVVKLFADDLRCLSSESYHMDCFEVNAVNYGAPQLRERALFIGNRFRKRVDFPKPTHGPVANKQDLFDNDMLPWKTLGEALSGVNRVDDDVLDFSPRKKEFLSMVPPGSNWRSLPEEVQRESMGKAWYAKGGRSGWWRRLNFGLPCPTLVTMPNHASTSLCHPEETRALSLKEYARIQEFPDDWVICGTTAQKYAQIGNAVPVRLGEIAGGVIANALDELRAANWKPENSAPEHFRTIYLQAHVRTRQWFKAGKTLVWSEDGENAEVQYAAPKTESRSKKMLAGR